MLEIPYNIPMVLIILGFIISSVPPLWKSESSETKGKLHFIVLAWVLWGLFQSVLSLNRWYMDRKGGYFHFVYPWVLLALVIWFALYTKKGTRWSSSLNQKYLWLPAIFSVALIPIYQGLQEFKQLSDLLNSPMLFTIPIIGSLGLIFWGKLNTTIIRVMHSAILISIAIQMTIGYGSIPNAHQSWDFVNPNYAYQHFPFSLLPSLVFPLIAFYSALGMQKKN